jgi:hypothetical protein
MPRKAAQEAIEWTEADRLRSLLGVGSIATMIHTVHRVGGSERFRVGLSEPPSFVEHDDPPSVPRSIPAGGVAVNDPLSGGVLLRSITRVRDGKQA